MCLARVVTTSDLPASVVAYKILRERPRTMELGDLYTPVRYEPLHPVNWNVAACANQLRAEDDSGMYEAGFHAYQRLEDAARSSWSGSVYEVELRGLTASGLGDGTTHGEKTPQWVAREMRVLRRLLPEVLL